MSASCDCSQDFRVQGDGLRADVDGLRSDAIIRYIVNVIASMGIPSIRAYYFVGYPHVATLATSG